MVSHSPAGRASVGWILSSVAAIVLIHGAAATASAEAAAAEAISYTGDGGGLQQAIDAAPAGATLSCERQRMLELSVPLVLRKPLGLTGLAARLPTGLGKTPLIVVEAEGVVLSDLELHGNYDSVDQQDREALVLIRRGGFTVERCAFYDGSKDGVQVCPISGSGDIVGGVIRDIRAFRMGRDAVSISGGNEGLRVRDLVVENVRLERGYFRGAVEVSDGTDNIRVRGVYAENAVYAVDVQDHGGRSAANTSIEIAEVTAVGCKHALRTANSPRGHARLSLRGFTARDCEAPLRISNTQDVTVEGLAIESHRSRKSPPIALKNCQDVVLKNVTIDSVHFAAESLQSEGCTGVELNLR
jgi:hypothetical protein